MIDLGKVTQFLDLSLQLIRQFRKLLSKGTLFVVLLRHKTGDIFHM
jgi:hypothetical protein